MVSEMVSIPEGVLQMGSVEFYPEEAPCVSVEVDGFSIDAYAVTNADYAEFVDATGYVTVAERDVSVGALPSIAAGSLVFRPTTGPVDLRDYRQWWEWVSGASWRTPRGPGTSIEGIESHPAVHIAYPDALAFAEWVGKRLPTEAEWEFAARGGLVGATFSWGEDSNQRLEPFANTWQGNFPYLNRGARGWKGTAPVGTFPPNGFGLYEMTGNTWEWTSTPWTGNHAERETQCRCGCAPQSDRPMDSEPPSQRVVKGGSHLCAPEYCLRYRPAARTPQSEDSATTHLGFRCVT